MRILLDECVPWPMRAALEPHECTTAQRQGWGGLKNGELLSRAEGHFDVFVTSDQGLRYQQNLGGRRLPIVVLSTNDLRRILAAGRLVAQTVEGMRPGQFVELSIP